MKNTSNPMFKIKVDQAIESNDQATYLGVSVKLGIMLILTIAFGGLSAYWFSSGNEGLYGVLIGAIAASFVSVFIASFSDRLAAPFSILYAVSEGILLGVVTAIANLSAPGIGTIAAITTAVIFSFMFLLYRTKIIKVTSKLRKTMFGILLAILVMSIIFSIFRGTLFAQFPWPVFVVVSLFLIIYGAIMLTLDFDRAQTIVESGADKRYEWRVSLGLMVSIVWIYIEVIRLLLLFASKKD